MVPAFYQWSKRRDTMKLLTLTPTEIYVHYMNTPATLPIAVRIFYPQKGTPVDVVHTAELYPIGMKWN